MWFEGETNNLSIKAKQLPITLRLPITHWLYVRGGFQTEFIDSYQTETVVPILNIPGPVVDLLAADAVNDRGYAFLFGVGISYTPPGRQTTLLIDARYSMGMTDLYKNDYVILPGFFDASNDPIVARINDSNRKLHQLQITLTLLFGL